MESPRAHLLEVFHAALKAVSGDVAVRREFNEGDYPDFFHVIAIGKAADSMVQGVPKRRIKGGLVISKHDHISIELQNNSQFICIESDHPVPKEASIKAGATLLAYLEELPENDPCVFLISGGASALVEVLEDDWDLAQLQKLTDYLLANAYPINEINAIRKRLSKIKGGGLWSYLNNRSVSCLMISDVPDDDPAIIGSGLLFPASEKVNNTPPPVFTSFEDFPKFIDSKVHTQTADFKWKIIASLLDAKSAAKKKAEELGYQTEVISEFIEDEASNVAISCVDKLKSQSNVLTIWGGETTVHLPENAGMGGRNQHLALSAAIQMDGVEGLYLLAGGTDGTDGLTTATGALVDSETVLRGLKKNLSAKDFLGSADSHSYLTKTGDVIVTGATGTNVMDLVLGINRY